MDDGVGSRPTSDHPVVGKGIFQHPRGAGLPLALSLDRNGVRARSLGKSAWVQIPALPLSSRTTWAGYLTSPRLLFSLIKQGRIIAPASLDRDSSGEHLSKMCSHLGSVLRLAQGFFN